jgi:excisionase family DNA binding protein
MAKKNDPDPTFLTPRQTAKLLNLPTHRVLIMIHRNELPAMKVGTRWRIPKSEVIKWCQRRDAP